MHILLKGSSHGLIDKGSGLVIDKGHKVQGPNPAKSLVALGKAPVLHQKTQHCPRPFRHPQKGESRFRE